MVTSRKVFNQPLGLGPTEEDLNEAVSNEKKGDKLFDVINRILGTIDKAADTAGNVLDTGKKESNYVYPINQTSTQSPFQTKKTSPVKIALYGGGTLLLLFGLTRLVKSNSNK